ncbi:MAG TPA: RNA pyrophosphohydrolase [Gammaproteobacteria bacterium]|nr:RNA pyrophosphohydrolase [Gammaproteobacteria bacterium]
MTDHQFNQCDFDDEGYRPNVGIIICNRKGQLLWARRTRLDGWQFPQGGVEAEETCEQAAYRELREEVGLQQSHVRLLACTEHWLRYDLPRRYLRSGSQFRGQKQRWYLFEMLASDQCVNLACYRTPEFDAWRWVEYWTPLEQIIEFKRNVYRQAMMELEPFVKGLYR